MNTKRFYLDKLIEITPRLTRNRLSDEGALKLCAEVLAGIRLESEHVIKHKDKDEVNRMLRLFSSDYYDGISMGKGETAKRDFLTRLNAAMT